MLDRSALAAFLRSRRDRLRPRDAGLPEGPRRRLPGLRRQEAAQLAGISVEYYIRLEQARGPRPSRQVLAALARAFMLTGDERDYLFRIADEAPSPAAGPVREVPAAVRLLLASLPATPAYVLDAKYDVLAWNHLATHFLGDPAAFPEGERNLVRWMFADADPRWRGDDRARFARSTVADLRAAHARYPGDRGIDSLVTELLGASPRFAEMWSAQEVEVRRGMVKRIEHSRAGPMELECQVLDIPETDQRLIVYCAAPGTESGEALARLAEEEAPPRPRARFPFPDSPDGGCASPERAAESGLSGEGTRRSG